MEPETIGKLATLPWDVQIVLGCGYLAYRLAYVGIRQNHKPVDAVFLTAAFGLWAVASLWLAQQLVLPARIGIALAVTLGAAILWRAFLRHVLRGVLRAVRYSWADETISAMDHLQENNRHHPTQLCVETADGHTYFCTRTEAVGHLPFGPYVIGNAGDVLIYADHSQAPGEDPAPVEAWNDDLWGANVTYIPADQVRRIAIRFAPPPARKPIFAGAAAGWAARLRGAVARMLRRPSKAAAPVG